LFGCRVKIRRGQAQDSRRQHGATEVVGDDIGGSVAEESANEGDGEIKR